jgi:hypothetical protein
MANKNESLSLKVDKVGPYGILSKGVWYGISSFGDVKVEQFESGKTYNVSISYSKTGKAYIQSIAEGSEPMIPKTKVEETKPSKGASPVAPAKEMGIVPGSNTQYSKDLLIVAQNVEAAFQNSHEWANMAMTLDDEQKESAWKENVKWRFDYVLSLAKVGE